MDLHTPPLAGSTSGLVTKALQLLQRKPGEFLLLLHPPIQPLLHAGFPQPLQAIPQPLRSLVLLPLLPREVLPQFLPQEVLPRVLLPQFLPQEVLPRVLLPQLLPPEVLPPEVLPQEVLPQEVLPQEVLPQEVHHLVLRVLPPGFLPQVALP